MEHLKRAHEKERTKTSLERSTSKEHLKGEL